MAPWVKVLATKPADPMLILTDPRLHQKSDHNDPDRNRDLPETLCPSHWLQTIETMVSEKLEFPGESQAERKKKLKVGGSQSRNLPPQRDDTVLTYGGGNRDTGAGTRVTRGQGQDGSRTASLHMLLVFYVNLSLIKTHSKEFGGGGISIGSLNLVFSPKAATQNTPPSALHYYSSI